MVFQSLEMGLVILKQLSQIGRSLGKKMLTNVGLRIGVILHYFISSPLFHHLVNLDIKE